MNDRQALARAMQIVVFLFAISSGFLGNIAPPESAQFSVGLSSLAALCIYLALSSLAKKKFNQSEVRFWVVLGGVLAVVAVAAALVYFHNRAQLTFAYPPDKPQGEYIAGTEYTPKARDFIQAHGLSGSEALAKFGGLPNRHYVWTQESINRSQLILVGTYLLFTLSIAAAVFCLVEVKGSQDRSRSASAAPVKSKKSRHAS
jgi:hypothetical protein